MIAGLISGTAARVMSVEISTQLNILLWFRRCQGMDRL